MFYHGYFQSLKLIKSRLDPYKTSGESVKLSAALKPRGLTRRWLRYRVVTNEDAALGFSDDVAVHQLCADGDCGVVRDHFLGQAHVELLAEVTKVLVSGQMVDDHLELFASVLLRVRQVVVLEVRDQRNQFSVTRIAELVEDCLECTRLRLRSGGHGAETFNCY